MSARKFHGDRLIIASHNEGKVAEIAAMLDYYVGNFSSAGQLGLDEPVEDGATFIDNAKIKALAAAKAANTPALADDSGLCVAALGGAPGVHSARWAERRDGKRDFGHAMERLLEELQDKADRDAWFACALALAWPDGHTEAVEGRVYGKIALEEKGDGGFGYDPVFIPRGYDESFGQLPPETKASISHRAEAFSALVKLCFN